MVTLGNIKEWQPPHGPVTTWMAAPASYEAARSARRSNTAPSYQQAQHLWTAYHGRAMNRELPRLMVVAWNIPGTCDIPAMTAAINTHVRRHDTYHSWFEFEDGAIVRRVIDSPEVIDFDPVAFGNMNADEIRAHVLTTTPGTLEWGCLTFGVVQHAEYFSFYASADHLHIDGLSAGAIFLDIHLMYQELSQGMNRDQPPPLPQVGSYGDYVVRQREKAAALTLSSPEVKDWIAFARDADGEWPSFPLPLGDTWASSKGDLLTVELLDASGTESFDANCGSAGARFIGGVLACTALTQHELTGSEVYRGFAARDTRTPGVDTLTVGWFASLIPVTVPTANYSFAEVARAAQESFDAAKYLADVPVERVLELAPPDRLGIKPPTCLPMMVSFLDFRKIPLAGLWAELNWGTYGDNLSAGGINMWINRQAANTTVTISFPDNAIARESVRRYIATLVEVFARVVKNTSADSGVAAAQGKPDEPCALAAQEDDDEAA